MSEQLSLMKEPFARETYYEGKYQDDEGITYDFTFIDFYNDNTEGDWSVNWIDNIPLYKDSIEEQILEKFNSFSEK